MTICGFRDNEKALSARWCRAPAGPPRLQYVTTTCSTAQSTVSRPSESASGYTLEATEPSFLRRGPWDRSRVSGVAWASISSSSSTPRPGASGTGM